MKLTIEQKQENKQKRKESLQLKKKLARIEADKNQKPVNYITLTIEWSKAGNPTCTAWVYYTDNTSNKFVSKAGGYGYCKESTVIAEIFNSSLRYKLYEFMPNTPKEFEPYLIYNFEGRYSYASGIGVNCYYNIAKFIGGKFEKVAYGKTFDAYKFSF
jgi:hypothetical protein